MMATGFCRFAILLLPMLVEQFETALPTPSAFKQSALPEWDRVSRITNSMRSRVEVDYRKSFDGHPFQTTRKDLVVIAFSPVGVSMLREEVDYDNSAAPTRHTVDATIMNIRYRASLNRPKGKDSWLLGQFDMTGIKGERDYRNTVCPWLICSNIFLPDWLVDDCFVITRIEHAPTGPNLLRAHFSHDASQPSFLTERARVQSGFIDVDPANHYRLVGYQFAIRAKNETGDEHGSYEYDNAGPIPTLKSMKLERPNFRYSFGSHSSEQIWTYALEYNARIPDEEFRLSHYGLPEPIGVEWKKPMPRYVWILLGAGVCAVFALCLRWLGRRPSRAAA